jgi:pyridoxamine 5'-phosphate oxidase
MSLITRLRLLLTMGRGVALGLPEASADQDPIELFGVWFRAAQRSGILLPEAMSLATCSGDGRPAARMLLLKGFDAQGFVFYTNYESRKAEELSRNPYAAMVFHWAVLQRQVRVEGPVERLSREASYAYFRTRARGSRVGAWASRQSAVVEEPAELERQVRHYEQAFEGRDIPLPPYWGGYRVIPARIEFWQGRVNRLHDRLAFTRAPGGWQAERLYP